MQSRPVSSASVFPSVPPGISPTTQAIILADFLNRFEAKKEDAKKSLHQQIDDVVDDLFHQLYNELMLVLPSIVPNESSQTTNTATLERPNILMFAGANSLGQGGNGSVAAFNNINASPKTLLNNGCNNLQTNAGIAPALFPLSSSVNHNPNSNPNYSSNVCSGEPIVGLNNGQAKLFTGAQKRDSPSKDLTQRPSSAISKHSNSSGSNSNTGKAQVKHEQAIDDERDDEQHPSSVPVAINKEAAPSLSSSSSSSSSVIVTTNSTLTTTNSCTGNSPRSNGSVVPGVFSIGVPATNHSATPSPGAQHESSPTITRVQQLHPHITHAAQQHHYHQATPAHSQATPVPVEHSPIATPIVNQSPASSVSSVSPSQAQQAHQHHPPSTASASGNLTPAPAHQSHVHNFESGAPVIVSTGSLAFHNSSASLSTSALSDDVQPVNLSTSAMLSTPITVAATAAATVQQSTVPTTVSVPGANQAIGTASASPIDDFDCPDEEYSDSDCDCEQCVGIQICKVDVNDDDHDPDMSRPLKKRLSKRARTDDSDDPANMSQGADMPASANKPNSKSDTTKDNNGLAGLGLNECPTSPSLNGDFQGDDDGDEECSATFKTISIKCSQNDCLSMFKSKIERNQHLLNAHNILPYTCLAAGCNKGFDNVRQYGEHVSNEHSDVSNWSCPKCSKVCPDHRMLCRHIYFYHQEGRFKCRKAKCNFVASFRIDVRKHSQLHTEMYACQFGCGKSFSHTHHRKRHERIHLRLKPFKCKWPNCGYSSEARSTVIRHIRIRHFNLPLTLKQQNELNIVDNRDPRDYMEILTELMN